MISTARSCLMIITMDRGGFEHWLLCSFHICMTTFHWNSKKKKKKKSKDPTHNKKPSKGTFPRVDFSTLGPQLPFMKTTFVPTNLLYGTKVESVLMKMFWVILMLLSGIAPNSLLTNSSFIDIFLVITHPLIFIAI